MITQGSLNCPNWDLTHRLAGSPGWEPLPFPSCRLRPQWNRRPVPKPWAQLISLQYCLSLILSGDCGADAPCLPPPGKASGSLSILYFKKPLYTHKLHEKWLIPLETMPTRKNQSLHCRLVSSLRSLSRAHKDSISFVPNIQKPGKVPVLMPTLKNRVALEIA